MKLLKLRFPRALFTPVNIGVSILLAFLFRILLRTPAEQTYYKVEAGFFVAVVLFLCAYGAAVLTGRRKMTGLEALLLLVMVCIPLQGAITFKLYYRQPVILAILAQREFASIGCAIFIMYLLRRALVTINDVERALLTAAWCVTLFWYFIYMFVDFDTFSALGGRVTHSAFRGFRLRWDQKLIPFIPLYYTVKFVRRPAWKYALAIVFSIWFLFFVVQFRSLVAALGAAVAFYLWTSSFKVRGRWFKYGLYGSVLILLFVVCPLILSPDLRAYVNKGYVSAAQVVLTGEQSAESSANARIREFRKSWPYIKQRPLLGNGKISKRNENPEQRRMVGSPNDGGIIAGLYLYGVLGLALMSLPYFHVFRQWRRIDANSDTAFMVSCKLYIVYYVLMTLFKNYGVLSPGPSSLMLILFYMYDLKKKDDGNGLKMSHA